MNEFMAILGTGAIGSSIGADLIKAGNDVLLIDQWPAHIEAIKARGLHITMLEEEFNIRAQAIHISELCTLKYQFDIVFLTCKSYDTHWMVELIKPHLKTNGMLISIQNSINDEWIAPAIGYCRDIGCAFELSAQVFEPGMIQRNTDRATTRFILGELHGRVTPRVQRIAQILNVAGKTQVSTNIWGAKWSKLVANTMSMALGAITGLGTWGVSRNPECLILATKLGRETVEVGRALGYVLEPVIGLTAKDISRPTDEELKGMLQNLGSDVGSNSRAVVLQDLLKRRQTEIGFLNGLVVAKGGEVNIPAPLNEAVTSLVKQIEQGKLNPNITNLEMLKQYL